MYIAQLNIHQFISVFICGFPAAPPPRWPGQTPEALARLANMAPLARRGTPDDIGPAVAFLVGADGAWVNGQVWRANGGMV